jgi:hypothetical protein
MIKSLRDLTLTLARAKLYYNRIVLRVIPPPARPKIPELAPTCPRSPKNARSLQVRSPIARAKGERGGVSRAVQFYYSTALHARG